MPNRYVEHIRLPDIPRAVRNAKAHDLAGIRLSIEEFGCVIAGELDERTGRLVVGHGRLQVLEEMAAEGADPPEGVTSADDGTWMAPIVRGWASRSDADAEAYLIANNRTSERGGWEDDVLAEMLASIAESDARLLDSTGYSAADLEDLEAALAADLPPSFTDDDGGMEREEELPEPGDAPTEERATVWGIVVTCDTEEQQAGLLERLTDEGWNVRALM
ncbi:hypothetical protein Ppa06_58000 [Planomonospora parontospora subsp. parontospora]|uniref:ParB/Sulfiredoxin domain-containing protein n=2 Tax=Planomonospora parontospora TaxID=58119 RepID=A0AA37BM54_9ACTN|nr:hypothetical protein [Planomonospora parontospora]GGK90407.1 hypothetical protein GCM10010126_57310 [Planomonospora parontospora]GII12002.1 hypothetical protein Ppa06_58000 [Planomonospora parontospora subsp. parontospora]